MRRREDERKSVPTGYGPGLPRRVYLLAPVPTRDPGHSSRVRPRGPSRVASTFPFLTGDTPFHNRRISMSRRTSRPRMRPPAERSSDGPSAPGRYPHRDTRPSYRAHIACAIATDSCPTTRERDARTVVYRCVLHPLSRVNVSIPLAEVLRAPLQHLGTPPHQSTMRRWRGPPSARPHQPSDPRRPAGARG